MPAIVRPSRIRHLDTLKSVSRALYNMDLAMVEALEMEYARSRQQMEAEKAKAEHSFARTPNFSRAPHQYGTMRYG